MFVVFVVVVFVVVFVAVIFVDVVVVSKQAYILGVSKCPYTCIPFVQTPSRQLASVSVSCPCQLAVRVS